jgi:hypothetical protein
VLAYYVRTEPEGLVSRTLLQTLASLLVSLVHPLHKALAYYRPPCRFLFPFSLTSNVNIHFCLILLFLSLDPAKGLRLNSSRMSVDGESELHMLSHII